MFRDSLPLLNYVFGLWLFKEAPMKFFKQPAAPQSGTRKSQREDLHGSGMYPASGPWPKDKAAIRAPADWNGRAIDAGDAAKAVDAKVKEKAKRAREGVRRRIKSDVDEAYSQGQVVEKSGPVEKAIRTT
jgi:hypothetical protein